MSSNLSFDCGPIVSNNKITVSLIPIYDPLNSDVWFKIQSGNIGGYFTITPSKGILKVNISVFTTFIKSKTFYLVVRCTDENSLFLQKKWKIVLSKDSNGNILPINTPVIVP